MGTISMLTILRKGYPYQNSLYDEKSMIIKPGNNPQVNHQKGGKTSIARV